MKKIGLIGFVTNVSTTLNTQGGGYHAIVTSMVKQEYKNDIVEINPPPSLWNTFDVLLISEGVNFVEGQLNLIGGPQPIHKEKLEAISNYKGEVIHLNSRFDFNLLNKRIKLENVEFTQGTLQNIFNHHGRNSRKCVIGDSHALSVWRPEYSLHFTAGKTLFGFLKDADAKLINEVFYNDVTLYFANIDIRHHLMRQENPEKATKELFNRYVDFASKINKPTIVELLPIEHESRKLPKTGYYKGTAFYGSREQRSYLKDIANQIMKDSEIPMITWPKEWDSNDGTKMLEILESKQSVHLKPINYKFINEIIR